MCRVRAAGSLGRQLPKIIVCHPEHRREHRRPRAPPGRAARGVVDGRASASVEVRVRRQRQGGQEARGAEHYPACVPHASSQRAVQ